MAPTVGHPQFSRTGFSIDHHSSEPLVAPTAVSFDPTTHRDILEERLVILQAEAGYIGSDADVRVVYGAPKSGWCWSFRTRVISIAPDDVALWPLDESLGVIDHEAGHDCISRPHLVFTREEWMQPGFPAAYNFLEDPRDNNFVNSAHPPSLKRMADHYERCFKEIAEKYGAIEALGYEFPSRLVTLGIQSMRAWAIKQFPDREIPDFPTLPEVREALIATADAARRYHCTFPSKKEADSSERIVTEYQIRSATIFREELWPRIQDLIEVDREDQHLRDIFSYLRTASGGDVLLDLDFLLGTIDLSNPVDTDRIVVFDTKTPLIDSLPSVLSSELRGHFAFATETETRDTDFPLKKITPIRLFSSELRRALLAMEIPSHWSRDPTQGSGEGEQANGARPNSKGTTNYNPEAELGSLFGSKPISISAKDWDDLEAADSMRRSGASDSSPYSDQRYRSGEAKAIDRYATRIPNSDPTVYTRIVMENAKEIEVLVNRFRNVLRRKRESDFESGFEVGERFDYLTRFAERRLGVPATISEAWQREVMKGDPDYQVSLGVDLSGSMKSYGRIQSAFVTCVILAEAFSRLDLPLEIWGYNTDLITFKTARRKLDREIKWHLAGMLQEVSSTRSGNTNDGWAVKSKSESFLTRPGRGKVMLVLCDGHPAPSTDKAGEEFKLSHVTHEIVRKTPLTLIGAGIGEGSGAVSKHYPLALPNLLPVDLSKVLPTFLADAFEDLPALKRRLLAIPRKSNDRR